LENREDGISVVGFGTADPIAATLFANEGNETILIELAPQRRSDCGWTCCQCFVPSNWGKGEGFSAGVRFLPNEPHLRTSPLRLPS
jgi:hypothetical protein